MNLIELFVEQVRERPHASAIIESHTGRDYRTSFAELDNSSCKVAALLRSAGVSAGDPVLIFHPISTELYVVLLAIFRLGAVAMFIDPSASRGQIENCCKLLPPRAFIASPKAHLLRVICPAIRRIPVKFVFGVWVPGAIPLLNAQKQEPLKDYELCPAEATALLTFTSGSTGLPKAAPRTHGLLLAQRLALERHLKFVPGEVDLTTLPIFVLANLASGI